MVVDLIECGSDNRNYLLTSCKSVALRDRRLRRMFNSSMEFDYIFRQAVQYCASAALRGNHAKAIFVSSSCAKEVKYSTSLELWYHNAQKFPFFAAAGITATDSISAAVNKYLRQSPPSTLISVRL